MTSHYLWVALFLLGCYHGIKPAMGWLFAVAVGLQDRSAAAVLRAIVPLTVASTTAVAFVAYARVGVGFLRTAWFNVDLVWAGSADRNRDNRPADVNIRPCF